MSDQPDDASTTAPNDIVIKPPRTKTSRIKWGWLFWEIGFPIGLPALAGGIMLLFAYMGPNPVALNKWAAALSISPWTFTFFSVTLVSFTIRRQFIQRKPINGMLIAMMVIAFFAGACSGVFAYWRLDPNYSPGYVSYIVAIAIFSGAVRSCYDDAE